MLGYINYKTYQFPSEFTTKYIVCIHGWFISRPIDHTVSWRYQSSEWIARFQWDYCRMV